VRGYLTGTKDDDITGRDIEVSAVHFLAAGNKTISWKYQAVGRNNAVTSLSVTRRDIDCKSEFPEELDPNKLYYHPLKHSFGLVDCFFISKETGIVHAFQTTKKKDHPFKLTTLWNFRKAVGIDVTGTLKLYFVNPKHVEVYQKRAKDKYLARGQDYLRPIMGTEMEPLLKQEDVQTMWNDTHIFGAFPRNNDWPTAIQAWQTFVRRDEVEHEGDLGSGETVQSGSC